MKDIRETERESGKKRDIVAEIEREEKGGEGGRWGGRELAQMRMALTQRDILSHTLHMSSPILSKYRHWSFSAENGLLSGDTTGISWWCGAARPSLRSKVSQQQTYSKALTLGLTLTIGQGLAYDRRGSSCWEEQTRISEQRQGSLFHPFV